MAQVAVSMYSITKHDAKAKEFSRSHKRLIFVYFILYCEVVRPGKLSEIKGYYKVFFIFFR